MSYCPTEFLNNQKQNISITLSQALTRRSTQLRKQCVGLSFNSCMPLHTVNVYSPFSTVASVSG